MVTLADVAARAGVSKMSASRALRPGPLVALRRETRDRILHAADELGYARNPLAGGLTGARTGIIAILVPDLANAVFADLIAGIQEGLADTEVQTIIARTGFAPEDELVAIRRLLPWQPDALVLAGPARASGTAELLRARGVACVEAMDLPLKPIDMAVGFQHSDAGEMAADHLLDRGCCRLAILTSNPADIRAIARIEAFAARVAARGGMVPARFDSADPANIAIGRTLAARMLDGDEYDGVFAANDLLAAGTYMECMARGIIVPARLAICGFNDLPLAADLFDGITTIRSPRREIGRAVADLIRNPSPGAVLRVDCHLLQRGTS